MEYKKKASTNCLRGCMNYVHSVTVLCLISYNPSECRVSHIIAVWNFAMRRSDLWQNEAKRVVDTRDPASSCE